MKCQCGCGSLTTIPNYNNFSQGTIKGIPRKYISGHNQKGHHHSLETREKISESKIGKPLSSQHKAIAVKNLIPGQKGNLGKKLSVETRLKMSVYRKGRKRPELTGEKSPNWRGGVTSEYVKARHSLEYRQWRTAVFERDKYTCIWCGYKTGMGLKKRKLNADHIKPFAFFPELRFELLNGRTLCEPCHNTTKIPSFKMRKMYGI